MVIRYSDVPNISSVNFRGDNKVSRSPLWSIYDGYRNNNIKLVPGTWIVGKNELKGTGWQREKCFALLVYFDIADVYAWEHFPLPLDDEDEEHYNFMSEGIV